MKKKYILMIIALFIASLNLRPSINSIAPLLETIRTSLGMNASVASLLTSIPVLCMGLFAPVAVKFSGKWGIERVLGWSLLVIGVGTILRFFTNSVSFLLITAFIAGIGIAFAGPLLPGFIKRHFPKHVPSMIATYTVALKLGAALSSSFVVPMQSSMNSWQSALTIFVVVQIPVSLVLPILLRRFPSRRIWLMVAALLELVGLVMLASPLHHPFFGGCLALSL